MRVCCEICVFEGDERTEGIDRDEHAHQQHYMHGRPVDLLVNAHGHLCHVRTRLLCTTTRRGHDMGKVTSRVVRG